MKTQKSNIFVEDNNFDCNEYENQYKIKGKSKNEEYKNKFEKKEIVKKDK